MARERLDSRLVSLGIDEFSVVRKIDESVPTWAFAQIPSNYGCACFVIYPINTGFAHG